MKNSFKVYCCKISLLLLYDLDCVCVYVGGEWKGLLMKFSHQKIKQHKNVMGLKLTFTQKYTLELIHKIIHDDNDAYLSAHLHAIFV